jgi:hypothetical protein
MGQWKTLRIFFHEVFRLVRFLVRVGRHVFGWDMIHNNIAFLNVVTDMVEADVHMFVRLLFTGPLLWSDQISSHMLSNHLRGELMNSTVDEKVLKSCEDTQRLLRNVMVLLHCNYHSPDRIFIGEKPSS